MDRTRKGLIGGLLIGLVLGPAVALAAGGIGSGDATAAPATTSIAAATTSTTEVPATTAPAAVPAADSQADLTTACTVDGPGLVEGESAGDLTEVEQAALDALRSICADAGMPLADPPGSDEVVEEIVVRTVTVSASPSTSASGYEGHDDDEYEEHEDDDEYDDDEYEEHEDEHEDEHEYEGEDD